MRRTDHRPPRLPSGERPHAAPGHPDRRGGIQANPPNPGRMHEADGASWLYGWHPVLAALANPKRRIHRLLATPEAAAALEAALPRTVTDRAVAAEPVEREALARLLPPGAVHQGLALLASAPPVLTLEELLETAPANGVTVWLDRVTDPHNIGAILRSCAVFGALAVIVPDRHAPEISGALAKAASGAVEHVPLIRVVNLARSLEAAKRAGFWCVGLDGEAPETLSDLAPKGRIALVLGAEGDGLRRLTREHCDLLARLPAPGALRSLNVSTAAAIALYEYVRGPS